MQWKTLQQRRENKVELDVLIQTNLQDTTFCEKAKVQDSVCRTLPFGYNIVHILMHTWNISGKIHKCLGRKSAFQEGGLRDQRSGETYTVYIFS